MQVQLAFLKYYPKHDETTPPPIITVLVCESESQQTKCDEIV